MTESTRVMYALLYVQSISGCRDPRLYFCNTCKYKSLVHECGTTCITMGLLVRLMDIGCWRILYYLAPLQRAGRLSRFDFFILARIFSSSNKSQISMYHLPMFIIILRLVKYTHNIHKE